MKTIIGLLLAIASFIGLGYGGYSFDVWAIGEILAAIPKSAVEYLELIKIGLWVLAFFFTFGPILAISIWISSIIGVITLSK